ncbi:4-hydroxythreonine-4-phosphate dehydrogenase PdxA [Glutamicibacter sp. AGC13]
MTKNQKEILILADDFSGACEVSLPWSDRDFSTQILLDSNAAPVDKTHRVTVLDTNSRYLKPSDAYRHIQELCQAQTSGTLIFKKIDSLWRGNLNAELSALADSGYRLIAAGALPHLDRTVKNGRPLVAGQPLAASDAWQLEAQQAPATIAELLADVHTTTTARPAITESNVAFEQRLTAAMTTAQAVIIDCESESDLQSIAEAWVHLNAEHPETFQRSILVGTGALNAALASALVARSAEPRLAEDQIPANPEEVSRQILGVVGSASGPSGQQLELAQYAGIPCGETIDELLSPKAGHPVILRATRKRTDPGIALRQLRKQAAAFLAEHPATDLFLTGGETARIVLDDLGIVSLNPRSQLEPGVVICQAPDGRLIGTKPGSFGSSDILTKALTTLRNLRVPLSQEFESMSTTTLDSRPFIAVTMGDGSGVGPEVTVGALMDVNAYEISRPVVIGDCHRLSLGAKALGFKADIVEISEVSEAQFIPGRINVIDPHLLPEDLEWGKISVAAGNAAYHYIRIACQLAMRGEVQGICTAPLNKAALHEAGHVYPGHTELLAHFMGVEEVSMMLSTPKVKVIHVTTHIGLIDAIRKIEPGLVERTVRRGHEALVRSGNPNPKIGVCAINPHAGENGLFGYNEEEEKIIPALDKLQADGINAIGPLPADTAFFLAGRGDYDLIVAMYHDQGHGPVKVLGIEAGVNITVGLPVIRTSVDHGTAFDIAGQGIVEVGSMIEALQQSVNLASIPVK